MRKMILGIMMLSVWLWVGPKDDALIKPIHEVVGKAEGLQSAGRTTALVQYVIDGDTFEIEGGEHVRLLGVDTPERGECYFTEATEYVRQMVEGKVVQLESDLSNRDTYGRLLRQVFIGNGAETQHLNVQLVAEGYAKVLSIPPDRNYQEALQIHETEARAIRRGLWGVCAVVGGVDGWAVEGGI